MTDGERANLVQNIVGHLADPDCGVRVAQGLGLELEDVKMLAAMSQEGRIRAPAA